MSKFSFFWISKVFQISGTATVKDILTENDITELFPNCNVEVSECEYETMDEDNSDSDWTDETMDEDDSDSDWTADDSPDSDEQ